MYGLSPATLTRPCRSALAFVSQRTWTPARTLATVTGSNSTRQPPYVLTTPTPSSTFCLTFNDEHRCFQSTKQTSRPPIRTTQVRPHGSRIRCPSRPRPVAPPTSLPPAHTLHPRRAYPLPVVPPAPAQPLHPLRLARRVRPRYPRHQTRESAYRTKTVDRAQGPVRTQEGAGEL